MGADERDATVELVVAALGEGPQQALGEGAPVALTCPSIVRQLEGRLVLTLGSVARRPSGNRGVGVAEVGPQVVDQGETFGQDLGADPGQVGVPGLEGRQR